MYALKNIHCYGNIVCPKNLSFLYTSGYLRAGIIPFTVYNNKTYILLGLSNEDKPVWADLGGRQETNETTLDTAIREFKEESRNVISPDMSKITKIFITEDPHQTILFMYMHPVQQIFNINAEFLNTVPKSKYEDEMILLKWILLEDFIVMKNISKSLEPIQKIMKLLI